MKKNWVFQYYVLVVLILSVSLGLASRPTSQPSSPSNVSVLYVKPNIETNPENNCSSWINACGIQKALSIASPGNEIWVMQGTYAPTTGANREESFLLKNEVAIYGGFNGTEEFREQRNPTMNSTLLSGDLSNNDEEGFVNNSENSYHVVMGYSLTSSAILDGFTITGGNANGEYPHNQGGGIRNENGSPSLSNLIISNNWAAFDGGGMSNLYLSNPTLNSVTFSGNYAPYGGGMHNESGSAPKLSNIVYYLNQAGFGGGMDNSGSSPRLTNVTFSANIASQYGGGMSNRQGSSPVLTNVTIFENTADMVGGIYNLNLMGTYNTVQLTNCVLWGNTNPQLDGDGDSTNYLISFSDIQGYYSGLGINGNINENPNLGPLTNNGGGSLSHALPYGSPAIDAGSLVQLLCPLTDQRGYLRPEDGNLDGIPRCDMGAIEYQPLRMYFPIVER